ERAAARRTHRDRVLRRGRQRELRQLPRPETRRRARIERLDELATRSRFGGDVMKASVPILFAAALAVGCTSTEKKVARTVLDIAQATCTELEGQTSTDYVDLTCTVIDEVSGVAKVFLARVRRIDAQQLANKSCPEGV